MCPFDNPGSALARLAFTWQLACVSHACRSWNQSPNFTIERLNTIWHTTSLNYQEYPMSNPFVMDATMKFKEGGKETWNATMKSGKFLGDKGRGTLVLEDLDETTLRWTEITNAHIWLMENPMLASNPAMARGKTCSAYGRIEGVVGGGAMDSRWSANLGFERRKVGCGEVKYSATRRRPTLSPGSRASRRPSTETSPTR